MVTSMKTLRNRTNSILTGPIYRQILIFFFPILLGSFFQQLYSTADALIVGQFVSKQALGAIGSTSYIINILIGFFMGLSTGATIIISQFYGADEGKNLSASVHTSMALSIVSGAIIMVIGIVFAPMMLDAMGTPADIREPAILYLRVYFMGAIPILIYNMGAGILRAVGDSKSPLYVLIICTVIHIALDVLFVYSLKMGIFGAGLATLISQFISAALVVIMLMRTELVYKLDLKKIGFQKQSLVKMLKIGLPTGLQSTLFTFSNVIVQTSVNSFGTDVVASWAAFARIDSFFWMIIGAFGLSVTTFVGQNFGAKNFDRIKKSVGITALFTSLSAVLLSIVFYIWCEPLLSLFSSDKAVIENGVYMFRHYCQFYLFAVGIEVFASAIRGTGDTLIPTVIMAVSICAVRILWITFAVPMHRTIDTILLVYPMTWFLTSSTLIIYYLHGGWLRRRIRLLNGETA